MNNDQFEAKMRQFEAFHGLRVLPDTYIVLRVDGRAFHTVTEGLSKPFDDAFHNWMVATTRGLIDQLGGVYGYTESDESSILLPRSSDLFNRSVEKLVSTSAAVATACFNFASGSGYMTTGAPATFDSRIVVLPTFEAVTDYFRWRQADAARCALNGWAYWTLRQKGSLSASVATSQLKNQGPSFKHDLLMKNGINFAELPGWQRNGVGIIRRETARVGYNPIQEKWVLAQRRLLDTIDELPWGDEYRFWLEKQIMQGETDVQA